jgi:hypothetical protein
MARAIVTNFATGTLSGAIGAATASIVLNAGQGALFPSISGSDYFYCVLNDASNNTEIVKVTARSSDTFTVVRGQDGTTGRSWASGDRFELRPTAALFDDKASLNGTETLTNKTLTSPTLTTPALGTAASGDLSACTLGASKGASLVLIQRQTASASSSIDFTTGIDSTYDEYLFVFTNIIPATDGASFANRFSIDGGATYKAGASDYQYAAAVLRYDPLVINTGSAGDSFNYLSYSVSNSAANGGVSGEMRLYVPGDSNGKKVFTYHSGGTYGSGFWNMNGSGRFINSNSPVNAVRFLMSGGNITSGSIALYGVKKA